MHGLIFETSIWLLAGLQPGIFTSSLPESKRQLEEVFTWDTIRLQPSVLLSEFYNFIFPSSETRNKFPDSLEQYPP